MKKLVFLQKYKLNPNKYTNFFLLQFFKKKYHLVHLPKNMYMMDEALGPT